MNRHEATTLLVRDGFRLQWLMKNSSIVEKAMRCRNTENIYSSCFKLMTEAVSDISECRTIIRQELSFLLKILTLIESRSLSEEEKIMHGHIVSFCRIRIQICLGREKNARGILFCNELLYAAGIDEEENALGNFFELVETVPEFFCFRKMEDGNYKYSMYTQAGDKMSDVIISDKIYSNDPKKSNSLFINIAKEQGENITYSDVNKGESAIFCAGEVCRIERNNNIVRTTNFQKLEFWHYGLMLKAVFTDAKLESLIISDDKLKIIMQDLEYIYTKIEREDGDVVRPAPPNIAAQPRAL